MFDPTGPLPPAVYWRRRAVAIGAVLLAAALLGWGVVALLGGALQPRAVSGTPPGPPVAVAADAGPPSCADQAMRVVAEVARPEFRVGDRVGLSIVVTNTGDRSCVRDTNRMLRELIVSTAAGKHIWSSSDCDSESTNERPVLQPGQSARNDVVWSGQTSTSDCEPNRTQAPAGDYVVKARLDALTSSPTPFRLVP